MLVSFVLPLGDWGRCSCFGGLRTLFEFGSRGFLVGISVVLKHVFGFIDISDGSRGASLGM